MKFKQKYSKCLFTFSVFSFSFTLLKWQMIFVVVICQSNRASYETEFLLILVTCQWQKHTFNKSSYKTQRFCRNIYVQHYFVITLKIHQLCNRNTKHARNAFYKRAISTISPSFVIIRCCIFKTVFCFIVNKILDVGESIVSTNDIPKISIERVYVDKTSR